MENTLPWIGGLVLVVQGPPDVHILVLRAADDVRVVAAETGADLHVPVKVALVLAAVHCGKRGGRANHQKGIQCWPKYPKGIQWTS